jgi:glutamine synthetase
MATDLEHAAKDRGIKYFLVSFTDMFGVLRAACAFGCDGRRDTQRRGVRRLRELVRHDTAQPDMIRQAGSGDADQPPWKPEVAWVVADLWMEGKAVEQLRNALKRVMAEAAKSNLR